MNSIKIPFNKHFFTGRELDYIKQVIINDKIESDGEFGLKCSRFIEKRFDADKVFMTTSCSAALDMSAILCDLKPGDEAILPSFTFPSTANSFLQRGANLRFADIRKDNLNIDESKIEDLITPKTRVISVVHYAGISCEMDKIISIAQKYDLLVIEDAAHAIGSKYKTKYLGTIGDIGCYSFDEAKNIFCDEGRAILINSPKFIESAETIREKGTNRSKFYRGEIDKYTWVSIRYKNLLAEILAAFLYAQLEDFEIIFNKRIDAWNKYYNDLEEFEKSGFLKRPEIPNNCKHNAHIFYIILEDQETRDELMNFLKGNGINAIFHYIPLHLSPFGQTMGYKKGSLPITEDLSSRLLRLPLFNGITNYEQKHILDFIKIFASKRSNLQVSSRQTSK